jgi:signal transduction histidine kinase
VTVADTGCGISAHHIPNVFNRFFRGDASRGSEGTGLGLSIVKSIMHIHRGEVTVESELGKGTVITLSFPDANGSEPSQPPLAPVQSGAILGT